MEKRIIQGEIPHSYIFIKIHINLILISTRNSESMILVLLASIFKHVIRNIFLTMQNTWGHAYPRKNFADIVMRAQMQAAKKKEEPEDPRVRRRRLYKIISEERPVFPVQERNFHAMVMDNKEVMKLLSILNTCMQEFKSVINHTYP